MTVKDISTRFGFSQSSIIKNFNRTAESIEKKYNIILTKNRDKNGNIYYEVTDGRAKTIYDEDGKEMKIDLQTLRFENFQFSIFIIIVMTPWGVFRGTRQDFLKYAGIRKSKKNLEKLDKAFLDLNEKEYIAFHEDGKKIVVYVRDKIEEEMNIDLAMIKRCRDICKKNKKNNEKIIQLVKVWLAIRICYYSQPFTNADIIRLTGLSDYQIRDALNMFNGEEDLFVIWRVGNYNFCKGKGVDLCAWTN